LKILFLHEVGYLEKPIFEMHEFPELLASMGHEVGFADYPETQIYNSHASEGAVIQGRVLPQTRLRLYSQKSMLSGIFGRLVAALLFPIFFVRVLRHFQPDLVVSFAVPTSGWQAAFICRFRGTPFVFRALDVSHRIRKTLFAKLVKIAEKIVYRLANWVSCNNPAMMEYCLSLGARQKTSSVDYPPLDLSHFLNATFSTKIRQKHGIPEGSRVILYMGSFFYFSGLQDVIRELSLLNSKPHLVLIGGGEQDAELRELTKSLKLEQIVTFTGFIDFRELPSYLSIADLAINPMVPSLVSHKALPNKVLQYMAAVLPVVTTQLEGLFSVFPNSNGIRRVPDSTSVLAAAVEMLKNPNLRELGESNRALVSSQFDVDTNARKFEQRLLAVGRGK